MQSKPNPNPFGFLYIDSNSGQSSGGHSALRLGDRVYHLQYSFEDKIFHIVREPWDEFRFQYGVVQNRNIEFYEWDLSEQSKRLLRQKWNELYLVQETHIQNQKKLEEEWENLKTKRTENQFFLPVSGFGYFTNIHDPNPSFLNLFSFSEEEKRELETTIFKWENTEKNLHLTDDIRSLPKTDSPYPLVSSLQTKTEQYRIIQKRIFVRKFLLDPVLTYDQAFLQLKGPNFQLNETEKKIWGSYLNHLAKDLRSCLFEIECNDWEEMTLLIRILYVQKSIKEGYIVFPKKNLDGFTYLPEIEIPESIKTTKQEEYDILFETNKKNFSSGYDPILFFNWESFLTRYQGFLDSNYFIEGIEFNWKGNNPYQNKLNQNLEPIDLNKDISKNEENLERYTKGIQNLYSYHLVNQNCTTELIRYMNEMFPEGKIGNEVFWKPISNKVISFNFIPSVAAFKLESSDSTKQTKVYPSYRNLKRKQLVQFSERYFQDRFVPTSKIYKTNPIDHSFLFFTEETIWDRPIYGLLNTVWGIGYTTAGLITAPFDKGKRFSKGTETVFYSLPELVFFNIRKGHFPFITAKEIPEEYYEKNSL
ncbi:hypothetical protein EHQ47_02180 [Leptospira bourretii]|nr:hypothetical protein EHQ47_02180 [Leptospira bourretii]